MKDTRELLIESAIFVFNEDLSSPLEKVAERANMTRRTLHRYFKDRKDLMESCEQEVQKACLQAITAASTSSKDPVVVMENMFFAGLDCGVKHAFLYKLHHLHDHTHSSQNPNCSEYDRTVALWNDVLLVLLKKGLISKHITIQWVQYLFQGIMSATILSSGSGSLSKEEARKFAWFSFSKGIGL